MKLNEIIKFLDDEIPRDLALSNDNIGFMGDYNLNQDITSIKILMDLYPKDDNFDGNTLIITHHPTLFTPKTPTFTIHSNWDIIKGGANEALANKLNLEIVESFDKKTNIGRICKSDYKFNEIKEIILDNFHDVNIVNKPKNDKPIKKIGIISGFGLKNPDYIKMAKENNLDILISGDLTQETAILAINLDLTLIDLGHHNSEIPGLYYLKKILEKLDINCEVIDKNPINKLK